VERVRLIATFEGTIGDRPIRDVTGEEKRADLRHDVAPQADQGQAPQEGVRNSRRVYPVTSAGPESFPLRPSQLFSTSAP
jgi:hypothetical protein